MQIIAIDGIPFKSNIQQAITFISKILHVNFEGLNFGKSDRRGFKVFYINVLDNVDYMRCVKQISARKLGGSNLKAFIPNQLPYMNVRKNPMKVVVRKSGGVKATRNKVLKMPKRPWSADEIAIMTRNCIMYEMQDQYSGLLEISEKTGQKLLCELANIIEERLRAILEKEPETDSCFVLSSQYRWQYPHNTDYSLIVTALQKTGSEIQLNEEMLKPYPPPCESGMKENLPLNKVLDACNKYAKMITAEVTKHINSLETDVQDATQNIDQAARYKVREQLKRLAPCVPAIITESLKKNFAPFRNNSTLLRVYGIPCLPKIDVMKNFMKKYKGHFFRSPYLYNCLHVQIPSDQLPLVLAADNTVIEGRRLVMRTFKRDTYQKIVKEISLASGQTLDSTLEEENDVQMENEEAWENWEEEK